MYTFSASTKQISHLTDVFLAIASINSQAHMIISPKGISLSVEYNHVLYGQSYIDPSLFTSYNFYSEDSLNLTQNPSDSQTPGEEVHLNVNIKLISESFTSIRQTPTKKNSNWNEDEKLTCYINYSGEGHPLIIEFEDSHVNEKLEFLTYYEGPHIYQQNNLMINYQEIDLEMILKSDVLANVLKDLQSISTSKVYLCVSSETNGLGASKKGPQFINNQVYFLSKGPIGNSKLIFPSEKTILEKLQMYQRQDQSDEMIPVRGCMICAYNFLNFNKVFKSVHFSTKCKILKDTSNTLSVQMLLKNVQFPSYSGTLVTFNMLGLVEGADNYAMEGISDLNVEEVFNDKTYFYDNTDKNDETVDKMGTGHIDQEYQDLATLEKNEIEDRGSMVEIPLFL